VREPLFHLALADEWARACADGGPYDRSTRGVSLAEQGYVHCSRASQVQGVADAWYRDADVVLLVIDPARVGAEIRDEPVPGAPLPFPHVYGPLPLDAVVAAEPVARGGDGRLDLAPLLDRHRRLP